MDLVAEMLLKHLADSEMVRPTRLCASYQKRLSFLGRRGRNFDRLRNRMSVYPRFARKHANDFDAFHLCDHSYSQLIHALPADRTGVFLHDLDTFRCLLEPEKEPRPKWFRSMVRTILTGLQKARIVFYLTEPIRQQIERHGLIDPSKLIRCPVAPADEFTAEEFTTNLITPDDAAQLNPHSTPPYSTHATPEAPSRIVEYAKGSPFVLHVGSTIARKRIDVLLPTFAALRALHPDLRLLQIGGEWTTPQRELIDHLDISDAITQLRGLTRHDIARAYRAASLVLQPSEAEGFGLPVIEALACAAPVLASDIPVLREVGGSAALYCPVGDINRWSQTAADILSNKLPAPSREARLAQAAKFSWQEHARVIASAYRSIVT